MCIIAIKPRGKKMFSEETIKTMFQHNPNGAGLMFLKSDETVHIEKGFMKIEPLLKYVKRNKKTLEKTDVVMHFRISTSGKTDELGTHPYSVWTKNNATSVDVKMGMVHNGVLDGYGWHGNDEINDTQVFIKDLKKLPHNFLNNKAICHLIKNAIGTNRLAFLDKDGIRTFGQFVKDGDYFFSNESYKPRVYKPTPIYSSYQSSSWWQNENTSTPTKKVVNYPNGKKVKNDDDCCNYKPSKKEKRYISNLFDNSLKDIEEQFSEEKFAKLFGGKQTYEPKDYEEFLDLVEFAEKNFRSLEIDDGLTDVYSFYDSDYLYNFDYADFTITREKLSDILSEEEG